MLELLHTDSKFEQIKGINLHHTHEVLGLRLLLSIKVLKWIGCLIQEKGRNFTA